MTWDERGGEGRAGAPVAVIADIARDRKNKPLTTDQRSTRMTTAQPESNGYPRG